MRYSAASQLANKMKTVSQTDEIKRADLNGWFGLERVEGRDY